MRKSSMIGMGMRLNRLLWIFVLIVMLFAVPLTAMAQDAESATTDEVVHRVNSGDTLYRIALRYGVTMQQIADANSLTNWSHLIVGQQLVIPGLESPTESAEVENPLIAGTPVTHVISSGETLETIARKYGTSVEAIMKANTIEHANYIDIGQELQVWTSQAVENQIIQVMVAESQLGEIPATKIALELETEPEIETKPLEHVISRGEMLSSIAQRYGVSMGELMSTNGIGNPDYILAGQKLIIPGKTMEVTAPISTELMISRGAIVAPTPEIKSGRFILIDISDSMAYAYEDGVLVYAALGSMGLPATPTITGKFKIYYRLPSQTMSGPGYYLPGVESVQYFYSGYALHGAYWHNNFGQPMSHGCVNLRNDDAAWFYAFGDIGTPVHVQH